MERLPARERVTDALVTLTAEHGLEGLSIRSVAAAAGVSIGTVQYYCHTKDQLLAMAFEETNRRILARVRAIPKRGMVGTVLRRALLEFLPLDDERRREGSVYLAFSARAVISADLAAIRNVLIGEQVALCADAFRLARARGEVVSDDDPLDASRSTVALVDGLLLAMLTDQDSDAVAVRVLDHHLGRYLRLGRS